MAEQRGSASVETREARPGAGGTDGEVTYLLLDGENLDATLGVSVLGHRPAPEERPRWDRVLEFVEQRWARPVKALFFINASSGHLPMPFVQALMAMGLRPIPLAGPPGMKVVDVGIQRTMDALAERDGDIVLGSHDGDFVPQVRAMLASDRRVALLGFREFVNLSYLDLVDAGLQIFDLEDDAKCFNKILPRTRIIDIDLFDPITFL